MDEPVISTLQAFILGVVEGLTEYLPVSSTGHLVIASDLMGLHAAETLSASQLEAVQAFEIVIQSGAILAVLVLYRQKVLATVLGALGRSPSGKQLLLNMACATAPVLVFGYLSKDIISRYLQFKGPVLAALVVGGIAMLLFERLRKRKTGGPEIEIESVTWRQALFVGAFQCLALWPGTSRSMVTIIAGMLVGLRRPAAAEFSFLIGLPALLAATAYKALKDGDVLLHNVGPSSLAVGLLTSTLFAVVAIRWLVSFLNSHGLAVFGWYRLALAAVLFAVTT
jgi:undecaprenyl-diphosphatase